MCSRKALPRSRSPSVEEDPGGAHQLVVVEPGEFGSIGHRLGHRARRRVVAEFVGGELAVEGGHVIGPGGVPFRGEVGLCPASRRRARPNIRLSPWRRGCRRASGSARNGRRPAPGPSCSAARYSPAGTGHRNRHCPRSGRAARRGDRRARHCRRREPVGQSPGVRPTMPPAGRGRPAGRAEFAPPHRSCPSCGASRSCSKTSPGSERSCAGTRATRASAFDDCAASASRASARAR